MIRPPTAEHRRARRRRWPHRIGRWWLVLVLLAAVGGFSLWFRALNRSVYPDGDLVSGIPTVLSLQVAYTEDRFSGVLEEWSGEPCTVVADASELAVAQAADDTVCTIGPDTELHPDGIGAFKRNLIVADFVFPIVYSLLAVVAVVWAWGLGRARGPAPGRVAVAAVIMGAADWIENTLHLVVLTDVETYAEAAGYNFAGQLIVAASLFATLKLVLVGGFVAAFVLGLFVKAWRFVGWLGPRLGQ